MAEVLRSLLSAPITSRARHLYTTHGVHEREAVSERLALLRSAAARQLSRLSLHAEELKAAGLPANEATRIRQYSATLSDALMRVLHPSAPGCSCPAIRFGGWHTCVSYTSTPPLSRTPSCEGSPPRPPPTRVHPPGFLLWWVRGRIRARRGGEAEGMWEGRHHPRPHMRSTVSLFVCFISGGGACVCAALFAQLRATRVCPYTRATVTRVYQYTRARRGSSNATRFYPYQGLPAHTRARARSLSLTHTHTASCMC